MQFLFRFPRVVFVLMRGGLLGHIERTVPLLWLAVFFRLGDMLLGKRRGSRPGIALAEALTKLGPGFIKFGQVLSTRADLLGAAVAADLATLQDSLPPFSGAKRVRLLPANSAQQLKISLPNLMISLLPPLRSLRCIWRACVMVRMSPSRSCDRVSVSGWNKISVSSGPWRV